MTISIIMAGADDLPDKRELLAGALEKLGFKASLPGDLKNDRAIVLFLHTRTSSDILNNGHQYKPPISDEKQQNIIHILLHKTELPEKFTAQPCINLVHWRGAKDNLNFVKLVTMLRTMEAADSNQEQQKKPQPRWRRRKLGATISAVMVFVMLAFLQNIINTETACSIDFVQPNISDICGYWGLGDKPTKKERLAWNDLNRNDCAALQAHARYFPDGAFRGAAVDLYNAGAIRTEISWVPQTRRLPIFEPAAEKGAETERIARSQTLESAGTRAKSLCDGYTAGGINRVVSQSINPNKLICNESSGKHFCQYDGIANCNLERKRSEDIRVCGTLAID